MLSYAHVFRCVINCNYALSTIQLHTFTLKWPHTVMTVVPHTAFGPDNISGLLPRVKPYVCVLVYVYLGKITLTLFNTNYNVMFVISNIIQWITKNNLI